MRQGHRAFDHVAAVRARCPARRRPRAAGRRCRTGPSRASPERAANWFDECFANSSTSVPRACSGGTSTWMTWMRKYRSSRNRFSSTANSRVAMVAVSSRTSKANSLSPPTGGVGVLPAPAAVWPAWARAVRRFRPATACRVRLQDQAGAVRAGVGEGSAGVPEQFALEQRFRQGRTVHGPRRARGPAGSADGSRGRPVPCGPAFAGDQHRRFRIGNPRQLGIQPPHGRAVTDHLRKAFRPLDSLPEQADLLPQLPMLDRRSRINASTSISIGLVTKS